MITKIQNIAMFALAAFAISGMMAGPQAFASNLSEDVEITGIPSGESNQQAGSIYSNVCGSSGTGDVTNHWMKTNVGGAGDYVKVKYSAIGCSSQSVTIDIFVDTGNGWVEQSSMTRTHSGTHTHTFSGFNLDAGDDVKAEIQWQIT